MFSDVKVGDLLTRHVDEGRGLIEIPATVVEVKEETFIATHMADILRRVEYRKSDGQNTTAPGDPDFGYVTK